MRLQYLFLSCFSILFIGLSALFFYFGTVFTLFDKSGKLLQEIVVRDKLYKIRVYKINSNATLENCLQVRLFQNGQEKILAVYQKYDTLKSATFIENDTLILRISSAGVMPERYDRLPLP